MTVFHCAKCAVGLTPDLQALPAVPDVSVHDRARDRKTALAPSTVPRGHYAIDPEPWGAPFEPARNPAGNEGKRGAGDRDLLMPPGMEGLVAAGPAGSAIVHPDDVRTLHVTAAGGSHWGCCGPLGTGGRNMACTCGTLVATLAADCMGPHELHLDPVRVYAFDAEG